MVRYCSTGQSPQWAVAPTEEEISQLGFRAESWNTQTIFKGCEKFQTSLEISREIFLPEIGDTVAISALNQMPLLISGL